MAASFADDFAHVDGAVAHAVGSRSAERAAQFAERHGLAASFGSYRELCADPEVDVVYVATPHPQHKAIALEAIANGKAVLVEKAFAATLGGARAVVDAARDKRVFAMEAMWTRFQPTVRKLHEIIDEGQLGRVISLQGDFTAHRTFDPEDRLFNKDLGGGALMDLGVYVLAFAQDLLGSPKDLVARGTLLENGVDAQTSLLLDYPEGAQATLSCSLRGAGPSRMVVMGEQGWVEVESPFHNSSRLMVHRKGAVPQVHHLPPVGRGYSHEIAEVNSCLRAGRTESALMPLDGTLVVQGLLEEALGQLGIEYRDDDLS
ncbi:Gfo/Idh/MocA family oxidoreductase [Luteococcus peritonei]